MFLQSSTTPIGFKLTPSGLSGGGRSATKKDTRPVSDKRWQMEQFAKVQRFLTNQLIRLRYVYLQVQQYFYDMPEICNNLKPPTLNTFVNVMNILLKQLDSRIEITMNNYKEHIPVHLKTFRYPGQITLSLMKCGENRLFIIVICMLLICELF